MKYSQILPEVDHRKDILRYYQKSIIKEEIEDMRLRRGMHWHEVTPNIKNPTAYFLEHFFLDALASLELDVTLREGVQKKTGI